MILSLILRFFYDIPPVANFIENILESWLNYEN